jgi:uncharacterized protein
MEKNITFLRNGQTLSGTLHLPQKAFKEKSSPVVVLAHGMANNRDEAGQHKYLSSRLVESGYATLRFDFSGCGETGRRGHMFIGSEWPLDLQAAIDFLQEQTEVDPNRIGVVGSSWGGGVAIFTAAMDRRIRCMVSLGAPANGERWLREQWVLVFGEAGWQKFLSQVAEDLKDTRAGEPSRTVRLIGGFIPVPLSQIPFYDQFLGENPAIVRDVPLEIATDILHFSPESVVSQVSPTPLLIVHGKDDPVVNYHHAQKYYEEACEPKRLCLINKGIHQVLSGETAEQAGNEVLRWLDFYLS